ncbi:arginine kinase-like [Coccinella septempunctata]|uniref:arginine kinase-like n=1 Tax=Coccinella septempunctata TaxID=41139 RepID=UPI001D094CCD|nr:arginine kinase-like [Coccinella septempunctata]
MAQGPKECRVKCVLRAMDEAYARLLQSDSKSLLKKYLTQEMYNELKEKRTPTFGSTLLDCIQSGLMNLDSGIGIYAPDPEAYAVFAPLFDAIIQDYHLGFSPAQTHPPLEWGELTAFQNLDPENKYIISTRVRCGRSIEGYPFNPCMTEDHYKEIEQKMTNAFQGLGGELSGTYRPLTKMPKCEQERLIDDHYLFKEGDRFLKAAKACRFWPVGRGIFLNKDKTFLTWVNEEDHLRMISMEPGGDLGNVYRRMIEGVNAIQQQVNFSRSERFGFLTFCPTNLGTTIRASVHIKVPKLSADKEKMKSVAETHHLQVRGTRGEHTESEEGIYDISNKRRLGLTEFQALKEMQEGILEIIKIEQSL